MTIEQQLLAGFQIILAAVLSMLLGLNRERAHKKAGVRTHMLTGTGSCIFTILSLLALDATDPSRVAAAVVSGIGFLGAGIIYKSEGEVHDLTTAASIWSTAAIGMAVGAGAWLMAIIATIIIWFILAILQAVFKNDATPAE